MKQVISKYQQHHSLLLCDGHGLLHHLCLVLLHPDHGEGSQLSMSCEEEILILNKSNNAIISKIFEQYFVNIYAELIVIQSLWNLTEDWTPVHETDCIGQIKAQNVTCLGFLSSSTLFSTPRVLRSLKAMVSLTPDNLCLGK